MSATRDKGQQFKFVYSNMYKIYKSGKPHDLIGSVAIVRDEKPKTPFESLQQNLKELEALHVRLVKMLEELEELTK